jgi:hypothetical protein
MALELPCRARVSRLVSLLFGGMRAFHGTAHYLFTTISVKLLFEKWTPVVSFEYSGRGTKECT